MNLFRQLLFLFLCPGLVALCRASLVDVDAGIGLPYLADAAGAPLPSGTLVQVGTFAGTPPEQLNLSTWPVFLADWQVFGSLPVREIFGESGRFGGTLSNSSSFFSGRSIYLLVEYAPAGLTVQAGLFTSPQWQFPAGNALPPGDRVEISTAQVKQTLLGTITPDFLQLETLTTLRQPQLLSLAPGSRDIPPDSRLPQGLAFRWAVVSDSGLPVYYELSGPLAAEGTLFRVTGVGPSWIRAVQPGNVAFAPAELILPVYGQSMADFLNLVATTSAGGLSFSYSLQPGFAYQPEYSADASTWQPLGPVLRVADGDPLHFTSAGREGFFRVRLTWE